MDSVYASSPYPMSPAQQGPLPHPYLVEPLLYVTGLAPEVSDADLARALEYCTPFRPNILRDGSGAPVNGTIEFKTLESAEKALATLHGRLLLPPSPPAVLYLSPFAPTNPPTPMPPPLALPRLVKHLPEVFTDSALYELFRPFGPLASVRNQAGFGKGVGVVEFWREDDARQAESAMHCAEVGEQNIAVQIYQPRRAPGNADFNTSAPPFVPSGAMIMNPYSPPHSPHSPPLGPTHMHALGRGPPPPHNYSPPRSNYGPPSRSPSQNSSFVHGPGQQVQYAPASGPGSGSHSGLIDPCNLFCKNLDPAIDSNDLFTHFRPFGQIVSARVMRTESGQSRGFGFVSYQTPDQAAHAMHSMNGTLLGTKHVVVRLHEPKVLRQEKLAHRFSSGGRSNHPRSASGATSPSPSEAGDSPSSWGPDRTRRSSGSYFNAALSGNLNLPMKYEDLSALSPVVRKEVLTGELSRRLKALGSVPSTEVDSIVESLVGLNLSEVIDGIHNPQKLEEQVQSLRESSVEAQPQPVSASPSGLLDPKSLGVPAPASNPEHPSTPLSVSESISTPPRTSSPSGSLVTGSERDRLTAAATRLEPNSRKVSDIVDLLFTLSKKERALCLFNPEYLKGKMAEAKEVLDADDGEPSDVSPPSNSKAASAPSVSELKQEVVVATPERKKQVVDMIASPQTPELSSGGPSAAPSPSIPEKPSLAALGVAPHTLSSLARLPATEIVKLANSSSVTGLPLPKADPVVVKATDDFIDGLQGKPKQQQKQQLGEKLFRVVKAFGIKNSPKVTISLLDSEDLRALAHLMNSYPSVLKEKVLSQGVPVK
ncbi:hypothetical protein BOTBODRAFT_37417 [Botryobasidium botryosum FD-172 SS1]|uniref:RRM domain-containing protein n=1 Tax=Botryobasidium botryosum (strain FD-172 SS1) TaxID=930990 RepID=A0A067M0G5_BOTB1|nr:hypothetical protein BOTBODRAFT_37417 [Botryobasidium botryosum FD-172 SS1]